MSLWKFARRRCADMAVSRRIVILSGNHLCHNPRVVKEAAALAEAGYDVEVLGAVLNAELRERDALLLRQLPFRYTAVADLASNDFRRLAGRVQRKVGNLVYRTLATGNRWQFAPIVAALRRAALRRNADLYIAHLEPALIVADDLLRKGHPVAVDLEDWYSEDLHPASRIQRPVHMLRALERSLLRNAAYSSCPSLALSRQLAAEFQCAPPIVVYNGFPWEERAALDGLHRDRRNRDCVSIHWFSQSVGHGRGLEDLFAALPDIQGDVEIHLRGNPVAGFAGWLEQQVPDQRLRSRVIVHPLVHNDELLSRISEHDIGFAAEMKYSRSRDLTVTNKILQYLQGGLCVVASDTQGQQEVAAAAPAAVRLYPSGDGAKLAAELNRLLASPGELAAARVAALEAARTTFAWETSRQRLLQAVDSVLTAGSVRASRPAVSAGAD